MENGILTQEEIVNGNLLITKFNGISYYNSETQGFEALPNYNDDWISLMFVVEKISKLKINGYTPFIEITNFGCKIDLTKISGELKFTGVHGQNLITNVWIMVVNFLEWYELTYKN